MSCRWERGSYCWWMIIFSALNRLLWALAATLASSSNSRPEVLVGMLSFTGNLPGISNSPNLICNLLGCTLWQPKIENVRARASIKSLTADIYPLTQCAAVSMWRSEITAPAQYWVEVERYRAKQRLHFMLILARQRIEIEMLPAIQGHLPGNDTSPPTILVWILALIPHPSRMQTKKWGKAGNWQLSNK